MLRVRRSTGVLLALLTAGCGWRSGLVVDRADDDGGVATTSEECDGRDDDGDGEVDEGIPPVPCGTGACATEVPGCMAGRVPECRPRPPRAEVCNGADDDCDGRTDESFGFGPVGEPIVVRGEEGTTGDCVSCAWAGGPQLWRHGDGWIAVWRLGFDGSHPMPNAFGRRLDADARPAGPVEVLFEENVTNGFRLHPSTGGRAALAFCGRFARGDDTMGGAWIDPELRTVVAPAARRPGGWSCGAHHPDVIWTGERHLFAWTDNRGVGDTPILLDVADADGRSVAPRVLREDGGDLSSPARMARGHGRVALVTGVRDAPRLSQLEVHLLTPDGEPLREPILLDAPPDREETFFADPVVAPSAEGWLLLARERRVTRPSGYFVARLSANGEVIEPPTRFFPDRHYSEWDLEPRAGGGFVLAGIVNPGDGYQNVFAATLDAEGRERSLWQPAEREYLGLPGVDLVVDGGNAWLIHTRPAEDFRPNEVVVRIFGCTP